MSKKPAPVKATGKAKAFIEELQAFANQQRELIDAECDGFATDPVARDLRRSRAQNDFQFFAATYFPHYVKRDPSVFHAWFYDRVPKYIDDTVGHFINLSAPRGEGKSTLCTQLLVLWLVLTGRKYMIPIIMDAFDQAAAMLEGIKVELEDNPRLKMDFPDETGPGRVWNAGVILTRNNRKIQAFGKGKRIRGTRHGPHRVDFAVLDDIENDENVRVKAQRDKDEAWVTKSVLRLGPPDGTMDVLYINTILHFDSVANRFHSKPSWVRKKFKAIIQWPDRMDLWEQWEQLYINSGAGDEDSGDDTNDHANAFYLQNKAEMERGAIVSWPSVRPLLELMKIRADNHHAFECELQNDPTSDEAALFRTLQYWIVPNRDWVFLGAHDPSLGKNNKSRDPSAMLVGGLDRKTGVLDIVEAKVIRITPDQQISNIIEAQREYKCLVWAFESVQFQEFMRGELIKRSAAAGVPVPAVPVIPHGDKELRIESLSPHVGNGLIRSHRRFTVFNGQLINYPEDPHDDGPDALEMLWKLAVARMGKVAKITLGKRRHSIRLPHHQSSES